MQWTITSIRCRVELNVKTSLYSRKVKGHTERDVRDKNRNVDGAIMKRRNKIDIRGETTSRKGRNV